jgi:hypothetical protein
LRAGPAERLAAVALGACFLVLQEIQLRVRVARKDAAQLLGVHPVYFLRGCLF